MWQPLNNLEDIAFSRSAITGLEGCSDGSFRISMKWLWWVWPLQAPTLPLQTVVTMQELAAVAMGTKDRLVQKAWSRGMFGRFSAAHSSSTHIHGWGNEGQMEWKSIMEKISAGSGICMSVGLPEVLRIYSSSCHEETVLIFTIFNDLCF